MLKSAGWEHVVEYESGGGWFCIRDLSEGKQRAKSFATDWRDVFSAVLKERECMNAKRKIPK